MSGRPVCKTFGRLLCSVIAIASLFAFAAGQAEDDFIFFCNYDVLLTVDDSVGQINSRARVRAGHVIPIEFQHHKIDIAVADAGEGRVELGITLFERSGEYWYQINPEPLKFSGVLGIPVQYQWSDGSLALDVAISVSDQRRQE
jgi:hypothetical protein